MCGRGAPASLRDPSGSRCRGKAGCGGSELLRRRSSRPVTLRRRRRRHCATADHAAATTRAGGGARRGGCGKPPGNEARGKCGKRARRVGAARLLGDWRVLRAGRDKWRRAGGGERAVGRGVVPASGGDDRRRGSNQHDGCRGGHGPGRRGRSPPADLTEIRHDGVAYGLVARTRERTVEPCRHVSRHRDGTELAQRGRRCCRVAARSLHSSQVVRWSCAARAALRASSPSASSASSSKERCPALTTLLVLGFWLDARADVVVPTRWLGLPTGIELVQLLSEPSAPRAHRLFTVPVARRGSRRLLRR